MSIKSHFGDVAHHARCAKTGHCNVFTDEYVSEGQAAADQMQAEQNFAVLIVSGAEERARGWAMLRAELWPGRSHSHHLDEVSTMAQGLNASLGIVAQLSNGAPVGFAEASVRHDYVNGCSSSPVLFLEGIYVDPSYRRHGVGRALFDAIRLKGGALGCTEFASDTAIDNIASQGFHKALGFEETECVVFFRQPL